MEQGFDENSIRPVRHKENLKKALESDLAFLRNHRDEFVAVRCPACNSTNDTFAFNKYGFDFYSCKECSTAFMNPRPSSALLNDFYTNSLLYQYWNEHVFPDSKESRRKNIFQPRVNKIIDICQRFNVGMHCIAEVGAGFGIFCEEMIKTKRFDHVIAIEPSESMIKSCKLTKARTIQDSIENITTLNPPPDVIVAFEVIEHLFSPESFLLNCKKLMSSKSILAITCPNFMGFDISTLGVLSDSLDAEHINLFNPDSITHLFERCGFEILECTTPGELDADIVRNKVLAEKYDISDQPFLKTVLFDRWDELGHKFQHFLQNNKLSSNMWIVARINMEN